MPEIAITISAAAPCARARAAMLIVVAGSLDDPPTTIAQWPAASFATRSVRCVRSSAASVSNSLATPG